MKNDPEKHADEYPDFRGSTVCGFGLKTGCIFTGTVGNDGNFTVDRAGSVAADRSEDALNGAPRWIRAH